MAKHYRYQLDDPRVAGVDLPHSSAEDVARLHALIEQGNAVLVSAGARFRQEGSAVVGRVAAGHLLGTPYSVGRWIGGEPEVPALWGAYPTLQQAFAVARALAEQPDNLPASPDVPLPLEGEESPGHEEPLPESSAPERKAWPAELDREMWPCSVCGADVDRGEDGSRTCTVCGGEWDPPDTTEALAECGLAETGPAEEEPPAIIAHLDAPTSCGRRRPHGAALDAAVARGENVSAPSPRKRKASLPGLLDGATIGARILAARIAASMGQAELAGAMRLSPAQLSSIERGETSNPRFEVCQAAAHALCVSVETITGEGGEEHGDAGVDAPNCCVGSAARVTVGRQDGS